MRTPVTHRPAVRAVAAGLAAVAVALYARTLGYGFVNYDDPLYVTENPWVTGGLSWAAVKWAFAIHGPSMWVPLTWLSHQAVCTFAGLDPLPHHAVNVALHALNTALFFLVLHRFTHALWRPACAALLLAVHPLHVESVAWVTERKDVLALACVLLTLLAYEAYTRAPTWRRYLAVTGTLALALMAKPLAVTLPPLLLLLDYWPAQRLGFARRTDGRFSLAASGRLLWPLVREKLPWLALAAVSSWLTLLCQWSIHAVGSLEAFPLHRRLLNAILSYGTYLGQGMWPAELAAFYPYPRSIAWGAVAAAVALLVLTAVIARHARRAPWAAVGWLWFLGTFVPMIGLVQAGAAARADRYAYFPFLGLYLLVAWGLGAAVRRLPSFRGPLLAVAGAWILLLTGFSWRQIGVWSDSTRLFEHAVAVTGPSALAYNNLGIAARQAGRADEAAARFDAAVALDPNYYEALNNSAISRAERGDPAGARELLERAVRLKPHDARAWHNLGRASLATGHPARAAEALRTAVARDPNFAVAHFQLGLTYRDLRQYPAAAEALRRALLLDAGFVDAWRTQAEVLAALGLIRDALTAHTRAADLAPRDADLQLAAARAAAAAGDDRLAESLLARAIAARPGFAAAELEFGRLWQQRRRPELAARHFIAAVNADPQLAEAHFELGMVYGGLNDHATAARAFREALRLRPDWPAARLNLDRAESAARPRP